MDLIANEAAEHIGLEQQGPREWKFSFPRLTPDVQDLYRDLRVDLADLLVFYPEFLDVRTDLALHAFFTGFEEGGVSLLEANAEICEQVLQGQGEMLVLPWDNSDNRPYLRSLSEQAYVYCRLGRYEEAAAIAASVLHHDPDDRTGARGRLAWAHLGMGEHARVLDLATSVSVQTPELSLAKVLACLSLEWQEEAFYSLAEAYRAWPTLVREIVEGGERECPVEALIYPVTEQEIAERYWLDFGCMWRSQPDAVKFVERFLGARA